MANLTIQQMLENQKSADKLHEDYKATVTEKAAVVEAAKATLDEALRNGDSAAYDAACSALDAAQAELKKFEALAAGTGNYLYSVNEITEAWSAEKESFLSGDFGKKIAVIDSSSEKIAAAFWAAFDLLQAHYALSDQVQNELVNPSECAPRFIALPAMTRECLRGRCNAQNKLGEHP